MYKKCFAIYNIYIDPYVYSYIFYSQSIKGKEKKELPNNELKFKKSLKPLAA